MKLRILIRALGLVCFAATATIVIGQTAVPVDMWAEGYIDYSCPPGEEGQVSISGTFVPPAGSSSTGYRSSSYGGTAGQWVSTTLNTVMVQPGRVYDLFVDSTYFVSGRVRVDAPQGYQIVLDNQNRPVESINSGHVAFRLVPKSQDPLLAGYASTISINRVDWRLPLGTLVNGDSAGSVGLIDPGFATDWAPLFTPARLYYESTSADVWTYYESGNLRQLVARQIALDVVVIDANSYEIRCYNPTQTNTSSTPRVFTGQPYVTYRIARGTPQSQDTTAVALQFTKEVRNVTDATSTFPITRREFMTLERTGAWPNFRWVKHDWYHEGESVVSETIVQSSMSGTVRSEAITVAAPGASTPTLSVVRTFEVVPRMTTEMLTAEKVGSDSAPPMRITYCAAGEGRPGSIRSVVFPDGKWVGFSYSFNGTTRPIETEYRPFLNSPSTVTFDRMQGESKVYSYNPDFFGLWNQLFGVTPRTNGVVTSWSSWAYSTDGGPAAGYANGRDLWASGPSNKWVEGTYRMWRDDYYNEWQRGKRIYTVNPDGTKVGYLREQWSTGYRETTITGNGGNTGPYCWVDHNEAIRLVAGKSTKKVVTRDARGLVTRTETFICTSDDPSTSPWGSWLSASWTNYTYNFMGLLTDRASHNGLTYHAVYDGFLKTSETDETGVTTTYTYDSAGRVATATRAAIGPIPQLKTRYTYDAVDHVLTTTTGPDSGEQSVSSVAYDDAGRITVETPAGGYGTTTHTYDVVNRSHTVTKSGGESITETRYLDGRLYSKTGSAMVAEYHTYGTETDGRTWERVDLASPTSARWTKTWQEAPQGVVRTERPGFNGAANFVEESFWNYTSGQYSTGHVVRTTKPGPAGTAITTRAEFNLMGEAFRSGLDADGGGLVLASNDRISESASYLEYYGNQYWLRKNSYSYPQAGSATAVLSGFTRERLSGFSGTLVAETQTQDADGNITIVKTNVDASTGTKAVTTTTTGVSNAKVETYRGGLLVSVTGPDGLTTSTTYDALLRPSVVTDSRGNTTTTTYVSGTQLVQTLSQKVTATTNAVATSHYDSAGRKDWTENADGKRTYFAYNRRDQLLRQWGPATYPVEYAYNGFGEKIAMRTFRNPTQDFTTSTWPLSDDGADSLNPDPSAWTTGDKTTWTYDAGTGLLAAKTDAQGRSVNYTYNAANQLATREWSRLVPSGSNAGQHVRATYAYDAATGEQTSISYNDGTPTVSYAYTRLGQADSVTDGATGVHDFVYDPSYPHRLSCEALDRFYGQLVFTRLYESTGVIGRLRGFQLGSAVGSNSVLEQTYGYATDSGRLTSIAVISTPISTTARTFRYGYETNSSLVKTLWTDDTSFFVSRTFDPYRDVLTAIDAKWGQSASTSLSKYEYHTNALAQRDSVVQSGDAFGAYSGTDHAIHQTFAYDTRGEVTQAPTYAGSNTSDTSSPLSSRQHEFAYDAIGNRQWAGVTGNTGDRKNYAANALNQVTSRDNSAAPFTGSQAFTYDLDGNVTDDGLWTYTWDAENRLITMVATTAAVNAGKPNLWIDFKYDYLGRRVEKKVTNLASNGGVILWRRFLYDGWSLVAEYSISSPSSLVLCRSYTWGLDIARSLTDAGGVGALLQIADHASGKRFLPIYDGNGNIAALVNASSGVVAAVYEYSPFGEQLRADVNDSAIADQPFRFSTKYYDAETSYYDYGHRYYAPTIGQFLGRDSIEEKGGLNLYGFCGNNAVNGYDVLGMYELGQAGQYMGSNFTWFTGAADESWSSVFKRGDLSGVSWYVDANGNNYRQFIDRSQYLNSNPLQIGSMDEGGDGDYALGDGDGYDPNEYIHYMGTTHTSGPSVSQMLTNAANDIAVFQAVNNAITQNATAVADLSLLAITKRKGSLNFLAPMSGGLRRDSQEWNGISLHEELNGNSAEAVTKTRGLLAQLAETKGRSGGPTQAAVYLQWIREKGWVEFVVYKGAKDETWALDDHGRRAPDRQRYGVYSNAEIVFDPYAKDALAGLAHELTHAYQLNRGLQQSGHTGEYDPTRVENEIRVIYLGLSPLTTHTGADIPNPDYYLRHR